VEDQESLETGTLIRQLTDSVENQVDDFLTNGVVTTGIVVGGIFLTGDELFWVEQLAVGTSSDLIDYGWFQVDEDSTWYVLAGSSLTEEGVEGIITTPDGLVTWHLTIRLNTMFKAIKFPASVTGLDTSLTNVDRKAFTHFRERGGVEKKIKVLKRRGLLFSFSLESERS